ncbi:4-hydroxy-tetrahydrodipicolinate synthase [Candidatus Bathyarchaeota archaeon]|jgi:4-hydroxy-tetrahydrodipicolinate synthase|nr:4-hydroxy-tetrahydrodipicolinate synthase [Candidatus Bathyarchaeota archaeon]
MFKPRGIIPPHITPFTKNGDIDEKALRENVDFWLAAGVHGLATCASNGEAAYMSIEERLRVISIVMDQSNGKVPIIAGTGAPGTREAIAQTKAVRDLGVDAALVVTPYFLSPKQEEILQYYEDIVEAVDLPIILYNVPKFTAVNMEPWVVSRLAEHENVVGVKDSSGDMKQMQSLLNLVGEKISVLSGVGNLIFPNLASGGQGGIVAVANVVPSKCVEIYKCMLSTDFKTANRNQGQIVDLNDFLTRQYGVPAIKAALNLLGHPGGYPRRPLLPLSEKKTQELNNILEGLKLVKQRN